jgi:hypothetical protein
MTKKDLLALSNIIATLDRGHSFLMRPDVVVSRTKTQATTTLDFALPDGRIAFEVCKDIGSELCLMETGIRHLKNFVECKLKTRKQ